MPNNARHRTSPVRGDAEGFDQLWDQLSARFSGFDFKPFIEACGKTTLRDTSVGRPRPNESGCSGG
jgi:hypothetical protein